MAGLLFGRKDVLGASLRERRNLAVKAATNETDGKAADSIGIFETVT